MRKLKLNKSIQQFSSSFFEKALNALKPPYMRLIVVLVYSIILISYLQQEHFTTLGLIATITAILVLALMAALLDYTDKKFRYSQKTEEKLKSALREEVLESALQEEVIQRKIELQLIQVIDNYFVNDYELRELIQSFHLVFPNYLMDYDELSMQGKKLATICGLVNYCHRRGVVNELLATVRKLRPNIIL